ncbi:MAG TPA: Ig domain-containing protein, partial [Dissulfurispiraceae bacterium]|nr:Ig domain-containing protein [Dissulfurispiraceae bacterium]
DVPVRNVTGNILPAGLFKKRDQVFVEVSPTLNGERGLICRSYFRVIHSAAPSLTLHDEQTKISEVIELQLVGSDPDGDKITYALEDPIPVGMTIDKATGKIMWMPPKKEPGTYRFRASATDSDGSQTIKTFEFSLVMK